MKLSLVIPCYNEAKNLPHLAKRCAEVFDESEVEVVLVNNGSSDESEEILKDLVEKYSVITTTKVEVNQGYGFGIVSGLKACKGDYIGWTHADMQTDPNDVNRALELIKSSDNPEKLYIKGKRYGRPTADVFFTVGMSFFESLCLLTPLWDINAQPNIFHKSFFESWDNPPHDFSLDLYAYYLAKSKGLKVTRFDVRFGERLYGHSHWNIDLKSKFKFIKRTIDFTFKLKKDLKSGVRA